MKKDKYLKLKQKIEKYEKKEYNKLIPEYTCIICKEKKIKPLHKESKIHPLKQEESMWNNGTVETISFGYGSLHDLKSYYFGICDNCASELIETGSFIDKKEIRKKYNKI